MKHTLLALFVVLSSSFSFAQDDDFKMLFNKVTGYMYDENYIDALHDLKKLDQLQPNNANVHFQIGLCYHYSRTEGSKSIPYFEKASKSTTPEYKDSYYKETNAHVEV